MGPLEKRIRDAMAIRAADPIVRAAEAEAIKAQINQDKAEKERAQQYEIATREEAARRVAWDGKLKGLLKLVGAREQLEEIRKVWGAGRIDRKPEQIFDVVTMMSCAAKKIPNGNLDPYPQGMGLALRYRFRDAEEAVLRRGRGQGVYYAHRELALYTVVGFARNNLPFVTTLYRSLRLADYYPTHGLVYRSGCNIDGFSKEPESYCIGRSSLETIFPGNRAKSREILREQLFGISEDTEGFLEFKRQADKRIVEACDLPGQIRNSASPHWYKRLPAVITVPIVRWW